MMWSDTEQIFELEVASTSLLGIFVGRRPLAAFAFEYAFEDPQTWEPREAHLLFDGVRAYRKKAEPYCREEEISACYDRLVRVPSSPWIGELTSHIDDTSGDLVVGASHLAIYLDSFGLFELVCRSWRHEEVEPGKNRDLTPP